MTTVTKLGRCTHRYGLFVSYLGTRYGGSQRLVPRDEVGKQDTIQEALEWSLENFLPRKRCRLTAASRTDRGVHALMNCFTLPLMDITITTERFRRMVNENLMRKSHDIVVNEVLLVPANFHPRRAVLEREYVYRIAVAKKSRSLSMSRRFSPFEMVHLLPVTEMYRILPLPWFDLSKAIEVVGLLQGEHDFSSFSYRPSDPNDTIRNLQIEVTEEKPLDIANQQELPFDVVHFHFRSKSFLHNQIRRIMGAIVSYATYQSVKFSDVKALIDVPSPLSWTGRLMVAEPWGLFLSKITFDPQVFSGSINSFDGDDGIIGEQLVAMSDDIAH